MARLSVFNFDNYLDFLKVAAQPDNTDQVDKKVTLDDWAQRLGYRSPSSLSMVLKGQRLPSQEMLQAICHDLNLDHFEVQYLDLLVQLEKQKRRNKDITRTLEKIYALNKKNLNRFSVTNNQFSYIADWYHFVVKQLVSTSGFREDYEWMFKRLRKKVSVAKLKLAVQNLLELGVFKRNENGQLIVTKSGIETPNDEVVSAALRRHHKGMIQRATESIEEQPLDTRYLNAITFKMDPQSIPEAKRYITHFIKEFGTRFSNSESNDIYQLNIQFFQHTSSIDDAE